MTEFPLPSDKPLLGFFEKQWLHLLAILVFTISFYFLVSMPGVTSGLSLFGLSVEQLYWMAFFTPIIHQGIVFISWRSQLYYNTLNRTFGKAGFTIYAVLFSIFFAHRLLSLILLAYANQGSLNDFKLFLWLIFLIFLVPVLYLFYSVKRYFGMKRAFGIDHFYPEYQKLPIVKEGIFKYTNNGMYLYGFLILYLPGLLFASLGALLVALFNHLFIWVHFFTVEKPDMEKIYG